MKVRLILMMVMCMAVAPAVVAQKHVQAVCNDVRKSTDMRMQVTNVMRRNPTTRDVAVTVLEVSGLTPHLTREMAKAMDKDAGAATVVRQSAMGGNTVRLMEWEDKKKVVRAVLSYGPGGASLVVREDYVQPGARKMVCEEFEECIMHDL